MPEHKDLDIGISRYARDKVIEILKHAYANDLLEEKDFEKRIEIATSTRKRRELELLIEDLPAATDKTPPAIGASPDMAAVNRGEVPESSTLVGVFSGIDKRGMWRPARDIKIVAVMGGVDLDFTQAQMAPGVTEIKIFAMMGGVDIRVPPGINVDAHGFAFMGGFEDRCPNQDIPGAPTLKIRGFAFMGGIEIKPPKQRLMKKILKKLGLD
jgi:hypothetical protein